MVALNPNHFSFIHHFVLRGLVLKWGKHPEQKDDEYYQKLLVSSMDSLTLPVACYCLIAMSVKRKGHHDSRLFSSLLQLLCLGFGFFFHCFLCPGSVQLFTRPKAGQEPNLPVSLPFLPLLFPSASCLGAPVFVWA